MRSKRLLRQLNRAFAEEGVEACFFAPNYKMDPQFPEQFKKFLDLVEESYKQSEDRIEMAHRSLDVSSEELNEANDKLKRLNQTLNAMLESLGQGFFMFDKNGMCLPLYSKACLELVEASPENRSFLDVLKVPAKKRESMLDWCQLIFSNKIDFATLENLGPTQFEHSQGRQISLSYKPVRDLVGDIIAVLVIATDKTEEYRANERAKEIQAHAEFIVTVLKDRTRFLFFKSHAESDFKLIHTLLKKSDLVPGDVIQVKQKLHSLKGSFGYFSMRSLQLSIHNIEGQVDELFGDPLGRHTLFVQCLKVQEEFQKIVDSNVELIGAGNDSLGDTREISIHVIKDFAGDLQKITDSSRPMLVEKFIDQFACVPLSQLLSKFERVVQETAKYKGKLVGPIRFLGDSVSIWPNSYCDLIMSLDHLFRNMVDHGIETPSIRKELGKNEYGQISVNLQIFKSGKSPKLIIEISDDGRGLHKPADASQFTSKNGKLDEMIFESGFTTAANATLTSGRGMGLSIVKDAVEKMGGKINVSSVPQKGTSFTIEVPWIHELNNEALAARNCA